MKKIVAIVGSPRKSDSITYEIVVKILTGIKRKSDAVDYKIIQLATSNISMCKGCGQCFQGCCSCVKYDDDIKKIENEMLNADLIIFASPVYAHGITGTMKNFIDRIAYWLHIMRLKGKYGLVVSVSSSNGNIYVDNYLAKIMEFMGASVIDRFDYLGISGWNEDKFESIIDRTVYYLNSSGEIINCETKNEIFNIFKRTYENEYLRLKKLGVEENNIPQEILYWKNHGYFECESFQDILELKV